MPSVVERTREPAIAGSGACRAGGPPLIVWDDLAWLWAHTGRTLDPIFAPVGIAAAVAVTIHVLLTKSEVPAATGWIGLAWVAPIWGSVLYFMFGINRVLRRARRLRGEREPRRRADDAPVDELPTHLRPLEQAVRRITKRLAENENSVEVFYDGDETYPVMLDAIDKAETSVGLSTYIMRDDDVGRRFVAALAAAQKRGVAVRVLIDGIGSGYFPAVFRRLRREGVPSALFMHSLLPWRMPFLNLRSHKKILVVDGRVGFTGGMNISAQNLVRENPPAPVSDTHFRFGGTVVTQLVDAFVQDWSFTTGEALEGEAWFPEIGAQGDVLARVVTSGPDADLEKIRMVMLQACACARQSIVIMTPYFLPESQLVTALAMASLRGVAVDVVVPQRSDHRFVDLAMRAHVGPLLHAGVRIWLGPAPFNHSKLMIIYEDWCLVGSANWDARSLRLNFEVNVEVYSHALAGRLRAFVAARQQLRLRTSDLNARSLPVRLRDAALRLLQPYI